MIHKINIVKLFGRFDYEIAFKPNGVTILTGPNGFGKSTILRCIEALSAGNIVFFVNLAFLKIEIFSDNSEGVLSISKDEKYLYINIYKFPLNKIVNISNRRRSHSYFIRNDDGIIEKSQIRYHDDGYQGRYITEDYGIKDDVVAGKIYKSYHDAVVLVKQFIGEIKFVKEQRLISLKSEKNVFNVIEDFPNKFLKLFGDISRNYSSKANELDSTYPNRLFSTESGISEQEYAEKIAEMANKFEKLSKYDISDIKNTTNVVFKKEHAIALKIYFDDFNKKYKVYEDFIKKLDLFTDIVNDRLSFKKIKISRELGILIIDEDFPDNQLKLNQLSSGEKQEIVLFYELIFDTNNNVLLLIDEPEISLHIAWQKMFMDDLLKIVEYKELKVIVATHSVQIINNHWDIQVDLGEIYGTQLDKVKINKR